MENSIQEIDVTNLVHTLVPVSEDYLSELVYYFLDLFR